MNHISIIILTVLVISGNAASLYDPLFDIVESGEDCYQPTERGPCKSGLIRYAYDPSIGECFSFIYGGCFGNANNFLDREECEETCEGY